jgi:hypothetical protein
MYASPDSQASNVLIIALQVFICRMTAGADSPFEIIHAIEDADEGHNNKTLGVGLVVITLHMTLMLIQSRPIATRLTTA